MKICDLPERKKTGNTGKKKRDRADRKEEEMKKRYEVKSELWHFDRPPH